MIVIVDYQTGNIGSIRNMLARIGHSSIISNHPSEIASATKIILPGVGAFDYGMNKLAELNLLDILNKKILADRIPVLGICLGAQLMCESSEEGRLNGLGWIPGRVKKFPAESEKKRIIVPHMGWDYVHPLRESKLFANLKNPRFYFAQSYFIHCSQAQQVITENRHGVSFHSSFEKDNIVGVQFHPEKSHIFGKELLRNFIEKY